MGQTALVIDLSNASYRDAALDGAPCYVGALDACLDAPRLFGSRAMTGSTKVPTFVLGVGPLAGSSIPGCNHLSVATHTLLADAPQVATLAGGGLVFDGLERTPVVLSGCASRPSILLIRRHGGQTGAQLLTMPADQPAASSRASTVSDLLHSLLVRLNLADDQTLLLTGNAARRTSYGALLLAQVRNGKPSPLLDSTTRGGFGSTLWQRHQVAAICLASDRSTDVLMRRHTALADRFPAGMAPDELERATGCKVDGRLVDGGTALQRLEMLGNELLSFNATSIYFSPEQRDELYERAARPHLIGKLKLSLSEHATRHLDCGAPCPLSCRKISAGTLRDFETHALLGPQLGVFERAALDPLIQRCIEHGFDVASIGAIGGWLFERLAREELSPADLGLEQIPRWSHVDFDTERDSRLNAQLAAALIDGLLSANWSTRLRHGLRPALLQTTGPSADWALLLELGPVGEVAPSPIWSLGNLAPSPLPGDAFSYQGRHFVPPRELGRACARRLTAQLALCNHGLCLQHRVWFEAYYPALLAELYGWPDSWLARHRRLARRLARGTDFRFWSTTRTLDFVGQRLRHHQLDGPADSLLDRWVHRLAQNPAAGARAFWSETLAGLNEELSR